MHLGIAILMVNKNAEEIQRNSTLFTFLEPLSFYVWIALAIAYLSVAGMMWLLARLSPYEWYWDTRLGFERCTYPPPTGMTMSNGLTRR